MARLTKNIWRQEVACPCGCGQDWIDWEVIEIVQNACDYFALKLGIDKVYCHISSGNRCKEHNFQVGGGDNSQHLYGKAIDFRIDGVKHSRLYDYLDKSYKDKYGFGLYNWGVHVDSRLGPARW